MSKKTSSLMQARQDLVRTCVNVCLYHLQLFDDFRQVESKDLLLNEMKPDLEQCKDIQVHVLSIQTPCNDKGNFVQMIFHLSDSGILSFLVSSLNNKTKK